MSAAARPVVDSTAFLHCGTDDHLFVTLPRSICDELVIMAAVPPPLVALKLVSSPRRAHTSPHDHVQDTKPVTIRESYKGADKLKGKVAIITGASSMPWGLHCLGTNDSCGVLGFQSLQRHWHLIPRS